MTTRYHSWFLVWVVLLTQVVSSQEVPAQDAATPIEYVRQNQQQQGEGLGTAFYEPSKLEQPFFARLTDDQKQTGGLAGSYDITQHQGKFVGWFGIVREVVENAKTQRTQLTIEHKYFDGLTDTHIQALSFNGSGDFNAELKGIDLDIEPLTLVKVYGRVGALMVDGRPQIQAEYVRNWLWGAYTFLMAAGEQHGSDVWRKLNTVPLDKIYDPHPDDSYYVARLGPLPVTVLAQRDAKLIRAAGPVGPELNAALLALVKSFRHGPALTRASEISNCCSEIRLHHGEQAAAKILVAALKSPNRNGRGDEIMAFWKFPEASVVELTKMLDDPQPSFRLSATEILGQLVPVAKSAVPQLIKRLNDQPDVRRAAIDALGNLGGTSEAVRTALLPLLQTPDESTRIASAKCLISLGIDDGAGMQTLIAAVKHDQDLVRYEAVSALKEMGALATPAVGMLVDALRDSDENVRKEAADALSEIGADAKAAVVPLAAALRDSNSNVSASAAEALGNIGPAAELAIPQLMEVASSDDGTLRAHVAEALGKIRLRPEQCVPLLMKMLHDKDDYVQFTVEGALKEFKRQAEPAVPGLLKLLRNGASENVRWHAAMVLGEISQSEETVRALVEGLGDSSAHVRRFAAYSLARIGTDAKSAQPALTGALSDSNKGVRIAAAGAMIRTGGPVEPSLEVLKTELKPSGSWIEAMWAAEEIATIGAPAKSAVPVLVNLLTAEEYHLRRSAAVALGAIGPEAREAVGAVETCLKDSREYVAANAAAALWRIARHPAALPALEAALKSKDSMARVSAVKALAEIGPEASAVGPALRRSIQDRDSDVRREARVALPKITGQPLSEAELPGATRP